MFLEQQISILEWFLKYYVTLKFLFVNNNRFINVSNDEYCVPKCKLKRLKPSAASTNSESKLKTVLYVACQNTAYYIITSQPLQFYDSTKQSQILTAIHKHVQRSQDHSVHDVLEKNIFAVYLGNSSMQ